MNGLLSIKHVLSRMQSSVRGSDDAIDSLRMALRNEQYLEPADLDDKREPEFTLRGAA